MSAADPAKSTSDCVQLWRLGHRLVADDPHHLALADDGRVQHRHDLVGNQVGLGQLRGLRVRAGIVRGQRPALLQGGEVGRELLHVQRLARFVGAQAADVLGVARQFSPGILEHPDADPFQFQGVGHHLCDQPEPRLAHLAGGPPDPGQLQPGRLEGHPPD